MSPPVNCFYDLYGSGEKRSGLFPPLRELRLCFHVGGVLSLASVPRRLVSGPGDGGEGLSTDFEDNQTLGTLLFSEVLYPTLQTTSPCSVGRIAALTTSRSSYRGLSTSHGPLHRR